MPAPARSRAAERDAFAALPGRLTGFHERGDQMTRLGYQIPNFTYPGVGPGELFEVVAAQAAAADRSGFDTVLVMDHFYQLPMLGDPDAYMLESYTTLGALSQRTSTVRLGTLVTGNTYRNPTLLAKCITALDVASGGRAQLGIGAGWFELEHDSLGFEFGTFGDRFEKLEEALQIILPMLRGEKVTFEGKRYAVRDAVNSPPPVGRVPVMIGGSGERKTLRMVAQYADEANLTAPVAEVKRKLDALDAHCQRLGRDRSEITVSKQLNVCIAPTHDLAYEEATTYLKGRGLDVDAMDEDTRNAFLALIVLGDPDEVGEQLSEVLALGIDGFTCNLPSNGHNPERVELLGTTARAVLDAASS
jgi:F420-dependent oxidoreductase-like protein